MNKFVTHLCLVLSVSLPIHAEPPEGGSDRYAYAMIVANHVVANFDINNKAWLYQPWLIVSGVESTGIYAGLMKPMDSVYSPAEDIYQEEKRLYALLNRDFQPISDAMFSRLKVNGTGPHIASMNGSDGQGLIDNHAAWLYVPNGETIYYLNNEYLCIFDDASIRVIDRTLQTKLEINDERFYSILAYDGSSHVMLRSHDASIWAGLVRDACLVEARKLNYLSVRQASDKLFVAGYLDEQGDQRYCYIGWDGEVVIAGPFVQAGLFQEGMAPVSEFDSGYLLDDDGVPKVSRVFRVGDQGLIEEPAEPKARKSWGYINEGGEWIIKPKFLAAGEFRHGLAPAQMDSKWGFIDSNGEFVIRPKFDEVLYGFDYNNYAVVLQEVIGLQNSNPCFMQGIIGRDGEWLVPPMLPLETKW